MVEFAKVDAVRPDVVLIDEPTVGLAPRIALEFYQQIIEFQSGGMTIFLIDHNVRQVIEMADYVYVMNMGRIVNQGARHEFQHELKQQLRQWLGV